MALSHEYDLVTGIITTMKDGKVVSKTKEGVHISLDVPEDVGLIKEQHLKPPEKDVMDVFADEVMAVLVKRLSIELSVYINGTDPTIMTINAELRDSKTGAVVYAANANTALKFLVNLKPGH